MVHHASRTAAAAGLLAILLLTVIGPAVSPSPAAVGGSIRQAAFAGGAPANTLHPAPTLSPSATWVNITNRTPGASPSPRMYASIAYDPQLAGTLLFGGINNASRTSVTPAFNDTWLFSNGSWSNLTAAYATAPAPRWASSLAWDATDGYLVLFGGRSGGNATVLPRFLNDTWAFNDSGWHRLVTNNAPAPRGMAPFAYDPSINATLLFSGGDIDFANGSIAPFHDTWTYAAGVWTNITSTAGTGAGQASSMAYDPDAGGVIATGIMRPGSICTSLNQTWLFSHGNWTKLLNASSPLPGGNLVYDGALHTLLYAGGCLPPAHLPLPLTWEYANGTWTNLTGSLPSIQGAVCCSGLAYDPTQKIDLLFGGDTLRPTPRLGYVNWAFSFPVGPLAVNLGADRPSGSVPLTVNLTSFRTGGVGPYAYHWDFHDGSSNASTQNVSHTFTNQGVYGVTYSVADSGGRKVNASITITVGPPLTVNASAVPTVGEAPLLVTFNATAAGGFPPYRFLWNFSDGGTAAGANGTHLYRAGGTFTPTLNVTDSAGDAAIYSTTLSIASPVGASILASPTVGVVPLAVMFQGSANGGLAPYNLSWQFGDGATATGAIVNHTYLAAGSYRAILNVTDSYDRSILTSVNVTVAAPLTSQAAAAPTVGVAPLLVGFTGIAHGGLAPFTYRWDFGDGGTATGASPSHTYTQLGTFTATVTVEDTLNQTSLSTVSVQVVPPLAVAANAAVVRVAPATVSFTPSVTGGLGPYNLSWTFGDGGSGTGATVSHTYLSPGIYTARVTVMDALGNVATNTTSVVVVSPLGASLSSAPASVPLGGEITLNASVTDGLGPYSFAWPALPPGCTAGTSSTLTCVPSATGTFNVTVRVTDALGEGVNASTIVTITPAPGGGSGLLSGPVLVYLVAIVVVLVIIAILAFLLLRKRPRPATGSSGPPTTNLDEESTGRNAQGRP